MLISAPSIMTETNLILRLYDIRDILKNSNIKNIVFLNLDSLYSFFDKKGGNISELINTIEPYIPLMISSENIKDFIEAAVTNDEERIKWLEDAFITNSKIKFINSVYSVETENEWQEIVDLCVKIRDYKEKGLEIFRL